MQDAILCYFRVLTTMFHSDLGWYQAPDYDAFKKCFGWTVDSPKLPKMPPVQQPKMAVGLTEADSTLVPVTKTVDKDAGSTVGKVANATAPKKVKNNHSNIFFELFSVLY